MNYFDQLAFSYSGAKLLAISPAHFEARRNLPGDPATETKREFYKAVHHALLEPNSFGDKYAVHDHASYALKAGKDFKADCEAKGLTPIKRKQMDAIDAIYSNFHGHIFTRNIGEFEAEKEFYWDCPDTGARCKAKLDGLVLAGDVAIIFDLKAFTDIWDDRKLANQIGRMKYHWQAAHYCEAVYRLTGKSSRFYNVWYEDKAPHSVRVTEISPGAMVKAHSELSPLKQAFKACLDSNTWPGIQQTEITAIDPSFEQIEDINLEGLEQ